MAPATGTPPATIRRAPWGTAPATEPTPAITIAAQLELIRVTRIMHAGSIPAPSAITNVTRRMNVRSDDWFLITAAPVEPTPALVFKVRRGATSVCREHLFGGRSGR